MQGNSLLCCPDGLDILKALIESCGNTYEVNTLNKFAPLIFEKKPLYKFSDLCPGDTSFSKVGQHLLH